MCTKGKFKGEKCFYKYLRTQRILIVCGGNRYVITNGLKKKPGKEISVEK